MQLLFAPDATPHCEDDVYTWTWLTVLALNIALMAYLCVTTHQLFILDHAEMVRYRVLHLGTIHYKIFKLEMRVHYTPVREKC